MDETNYGYWFPPDVSTHGVQIDQLIDIVHWFMLILFVGWGIFFVYCLIKYRARPGHAATYLPPKAQFTKVIEVSVIVIEVLLLFWFSTPVWFAYKNHPPPEKDALVIKLVAEQFAWDFHYAGKDGKSAGPARRACRATTRWAWTRMTRTARTTSSPSISSISR